MKVYELIEVLETAMGMYGDLDIYMDVGDEEEVLHIEEVLCETNPGDTEQRLLLCHNAYTIEKPMLRIVK